MATTKDPGTGSNQDDTAAQDPSKNTSREDAGLPPWQEDEALKERMKLDAQADQDATSEKPEKAEKAK